MNRSRSVTLIAGLLAAATFIAPPAARAGSYAVYACHPSEPRNNSFAAYSNSSSLTAYSSCPVQDLSHTVTGVVTRANYMPAGARVPYGAIAWQEFDAPPGASLSSINFNASLGHTGEWSLSLRAWNNDDFYAAPFLWGMAADGSGYVASPSFVGPQSVGLSGYSKVRFGLRCEPDAGSACEVSTLWNGQPRAWMNLKDIVVVVEDYSTPAVSPITGALYAGGWHRGVEQAWASFGDNVGIRFIRLRIDGGYGDTQDFNVAGWPPGVRCDYTLRRPCNDIPNGGLTLDTSTLSDGLHTVAVQGIDAAGNVGEYAHDIYTDNTAPERATNVAVSGGEGWQRGNDFRVSWDNPGGQFAPITTAHYELCRVKEPGECRSGTQRGDGIATLSGLAVPDQGDYTLRVWLEDAAGNAEPRRVSDVVHLRFDPQVDVATFEEQDAADPRRLTVLVDDYASGIAGGALEMRARGADGWLGLATKLANGRLVALVPDTELEDGAYEFRARVFDVAGNERITDRYGDGSRVVLALPLRRATRLTGEATGPAAIVCRTQVRRVRRGGRTRIVRERRCRAEGTRRAAFGGTLKIPYGQPLTIRGMLETFDGRPVSRGVVDLSSRLRGASAFDSAATLRAGGDGRFSYTVPAGPSRTVRLAYEGSELLKPASAQLGVLVPAATEMRANRRRARNGQRVVFSGLLVGKPLPAGGKLVELQAFFRGAWRTFATTRADRRGNWAYAYRFGATRGTVVYRFRARIDREDAYPYELGYGPVVAVTVRGR